VVISTTRTGEIAKTKLRPEQRSKIFLKHGDALSAAQGQDFSGLWQVQVQWLKMASEFRQTITGVLL
jgi:hypothetical protein